MYGNQCRLFDENVVRQIMLTTGMSIIEFIKNSTVTDAEAVCDFIDTHAGHIIDRTLETFTPENAASGLSESTTFEDEDVEDLPFDSPPKW